MRTLPLRLAPVEGESLPGYVARYSHTFQFPPGDVLRALGLDGGTGLVLAAGRYGGWLAADQLEHVAFATGIDPATVERMLLSRFAGRALQQPAEAVNTALAAAVKAHEVLIRCSRFCPHCLHENSAWLLCWQLGWSFICVAHRVLLVRRCPSCDTVPKAALRHSWPSDRSGALSDPTRCAHRLSRELCRGQLAKADTPTVDDATVAAQRRINAVLNGESTPTLAGVQLEPEIYLRDVLTLCNLLDRHARPPGQATPSRLLGRRLHDHPADLAAVLPRALALADLADPEALTEALRALADQRYRDDGLTLLASKTGAMSGQLTAVLQGAVSQAVWASPSRQLGLHPSAHRRPGDLDERLQPPHVPQLFWVEDYDQELAHLFEFDDFTHWLGRRFCSVLLARMLTPLDWQGAVRYLGFPERFINGGYNTTFAKLRSSGRFDELAIRVKAIANRHVNDGLIDYKQRRARLADWDGIEIESWHLLQPRPRPLSPWRRVDMPVRRAQASLWVWCHLTSGHERAAPVPIPTARGLSDQTMFIRDALPTLRERLQILGELLLTTPASARSTLHNRLAAALHQHGYLTESYYLDTVDPLITSRVLAHVGAHTGIDIPTLKTPCQRTQTPPAVTHARLLAAALLRRTALASWSAVAATIGWGANRLACDGRAYNAAVERQPRLADELEQLRRAIEDWQTPAPLVPTTPHRERMSHVAKRIRACAGELFTGPYGPDVALRASIAVCREHTDLTGETLAAIHHIKDAQLAFSRATLASHQHADCDFDRRYRQLLNHAQAAQREAGFANANLKRGLTTGRAI